MSVDPSPEQRLQQLRQDLVKEVQGLPEVIRSHQPGLLVDYLATIFKEQDVEPVPRPAVTNPDCKPAAPSKWQLLGALLEEGSGSREAEEETAQMDTAAQQLLSSIADIERDTSTPPSQLSILRNGRSTGLTDPHLQLLCCDKCKRVMLACAFQSHLQHCKAVSPEPDPSPANSLGSLPASSGATSGSLGARKPPKGKRKPGPSKLSKVSKLGARQQQQQHQCAELDAYAALDPAGPRRSQHCGTPDPMDADEQFYDPAEELFYSDAAEMADDGAQGYAVGRGAAAGMDADVSDDGQCIDGAGYAVTVQRRPRSRLREGRQRPWMYHAPIRTPRGWSTAAAYPPVLPQYVPYDGAY